MFPTGLPRANSLGTSVSLNGRQRYPPGSMPPSFANRKRVALHKSNNPRRFLNHLYAEVGNASTIRSDIRFKLERTENGRENNRREGCREGGIWTCDGRRCGYLRQDCGWGCGGHSNQVVEEDAPAEGREESGGTPASEEGRSKESCQENSGKDGTDQESRF